MKRCLFTLLALFLFGISSIYAANYDNIVNQINQIAQNNSAYAQVIDIGTNDQGNKIYGLKIEDISVLEDGKPAHLIVGTHHGNEGTAATLSVNLAQKLIDTMKAGKTAISGCVFYVIPVLNISGYNANRRTEVNKSGSYVDPNRDYPDPCVSASYYELASTKNLSLFVERYNIVGSVTIHGYIGTFTYSWGIYTSNTKTPDDTQFRTMASEAVKANGYQTGTHTDVIYPAAGSYEDWAYYQFGVWSMLLELDSSANLTKDAQCLITYFTLVPASQSGNHSHNPANCTSTRGTDSRP